MWQQERSGRRGDWNARMHAWKPGAWADSALRSQNEVIADAHQAGITWIQNAVAAGEARGDAAATEFVAAVVAAAAVAAAVAMRQGRVVPD